jgi:hypothetical protein
MNGMRPTEHARAATAATVLAGAVLVASIFTASISHATPGIVKTKSGAIYSGDVEERGQSVTVNIRGVITRLPKSDVDSIEYQEGTIDGQIETRHAQLAGDDVKGRIELARLALDHQMFDKALALALEAVQIDPTNEDAIAIRQTVRMQKQQHQSAQRASATQKPVVALTTTAPATSAAASGAKGGGSGSASCDAASSAIQAFVDMTCPCAGVDDGNGGTTAWKNHGQYVRCVSHAVREAARAAGVKRRCAKSMVPCAANSSCGKKNAVACVVGTECGVVSADRCAAAGGTATSGSCCSASPSGAFLD